MHCTTASGTLTSEHTHTQNPVAFRRSTEMQIVGVQKVRPEDVAWAFTQVVRYCAENDEQITITDLCEKLKEYLNWDTPYTEKYVKLKLESHFGEDVILTGIRGKRNGVISRSAAKKILERFFLICQGKRRGGGGGGWSLQIAAKLLLVNINNIETSKEYASGAKIADLAANLDYIPPSLLAF